MTIVSFTLSEDGVIAFQNVLACILKFSDDVHLEARRDKLVLTALNSIQSTYISFTFTANRFFSCYGYEGGSQHRERFFCVLYIRALLSVFRSRLGADPSRDRDKETTIERCDVSIDDGPGKKSRFVAKIVCRNGVTATHGLPFEVKVPTHAKFDKNEAVNHWAISARTLRQLMEHFGPRVELLDISATNENVVNFACYTERQYNKVDGKEFLSKPLHTSVAVDMEEFDVVEIHNKDHIVVSLKDFRAVLQHAGITNGELSACYSTPGRPMKLSYTGDAILCEFILMTVADRASSEPRSKNVPSKEARGARRPAPLEAASNHGSSALPAEETPSRPVQQSHIPKQTGGRPSAPRPSQFEMRPPPIPPSTMRSESLFVPQDDDNQWEPVNPDDEEDEGDQARLEWDASTRSDSTAPRITGHFPAPDDQRGRVEEFPSGLEPTQQLSEVRKFGLFSG